MKIVITSGARYVDIDAVASAFLFKDLLTLKNIESVIVFPGPINSSVPKSVLDWGVSVATELPREEVRFAVVDISDRTGFPNFVTNEKIYAIYDHHIVYKNDWKGVNIPTVIIEEIGACATLIWEEIKKQKLEDKISTISAKLAYTALFSNTLNFNAKITTDRDKKAFAELEKISGLDKKWIEKYYKETEEEIINNPLDAIKNDTKIVEISGSSNPIAIGQIELWNSKNFINQNKENIKKILSNLSSVWFMTAPSISEGVNYLYTENKETQKLLKDRINANFINDMGVTNKLWLRKEILKELY